MRRLGRPLQHALGPYDHLCGGRHNALSHKDADQKALAKELVCDRAQGNVHPECALFCINIVARKAAELRGGPVTRFLIDATEPARAKAIHDCAEYTYEELSAGKTLGETVKNLDDKRVATVEKFTRRWFKNLTGEDVVIEFLRIGKAARRTSKLALKYFAFDPLLDVRVTVGDKTAVLEHYVDDVIPKASMGEYKEIAWAAPYAAAASADLMLAGCNLINVVIPAAVAAAMNKYTPEDAAAEAEQAAYITCGIPGGKAAATKVARLAEEIIAFSDFEY